MSRQTLSRAKRDGLVRLARFLGEPTDLSSHALVERVVHRLDADDMKPWPPPAYERRW